MDKQKITRQLHRLAQEEIPNNMNLWPNIQAKLKRKSKPRPFSLAHALSIFVMTMLVAVGGYVAYQTDNAPEPIAPSYGVELDIFQTDGPVSATIDWAYADENIIAIQYSLIYDPELLSYPYVHNSLYTLGYWSPSNGTSFAPEQLADGNMRYTSIRYYSAHGAAMEDIETLNVLFDILVFENEPNWDFGFIVPAPATVLPHAAMTATPLPFDSSMATPVPLDSDMATPTPAGQSIATGTPFGEFEPTVPPPDTFSIEPSLIPPVAFDQDTVIAYGTLPTGTFRFNFTLPVHESRTGQAAEAELESSGTEITVQNVLVTPLLTSFELCYQYPDLLGTWTPNVAVDTGFAPTDAERYSPIIETMRAEFGKVYMAGIDAAFTYPSPWTGFDWEFNLDPITHVNCAPMSSFAPYSEESTELDIRVDYLYRDTDPLDISVWANDVEFFAARGFSVSYELLRPNDEVTGANVVLRPVGDIGEVMAIIYDYPDSMTLAEAWEYVAEHMLKERVDGDWSFHITLE